MVRILAPITPFITEKIYQEIFRKNMLNAPESIHFTTWPKIESDLIDQELEKRMSIAKEIVEKAYVLRNEAKIKLRWPIDKLFVDIDEDKIEDVKHIIKIMTNVKEICVTNIDPSLKQVSFQHGSLALGDVLFDEGWVRDLIRNIQVLRKNAKLNVTDKIAAWIDGDKEKIEIIKRFENMFAKGINASQIYYSKHEKSKEIKIGDKVIRVYFEKV